MKSDTETVKKILTDAIVALCNSGLAFSRELSVEGLLGITLDNRDVFLVNINEVIRNTHMSTRLKQRKSAPGTYVKMYAHKKLQQARRRKPAVVHRAVCVTTEADAAEEEEELPQTGGERKGGKGRGGGGGVEDYSTEVDDDKVTEELYQSGDLEESDLPPRKRARKTRRPRPCRQYAPKNEAKSNNVEASKADPFQVR